jgi:phosphate:Na+ symporter
VTGAAITFSLLGGVALLLWGLRMVRTGMERAFGARIKAVTQHRVGNRAKGFIVGLIAAFVLQSGTAVALVTSSLAGRGFLASVVCLSIILGADLGSALVASVLALDLFWASPALLFLGLIAFSNSRSARSKQLGRVMIGLGLIFLALRNIVQASVAASDSEAVLAILASTFADPFLAILIAAGLTFLTYSSLAIILLVMALASTVAISTQSVLFLVLGVNLGASLPAVATTIGHNLSARRPIIGNFLCRLTGIGILLGLVPLIADNRMLSEWTSPELVIMAHIAFNAYLGVLFLPLAGIYDRLALKLLPKKVDLHRDELAPKYLAGPSSQTASLALTNAVRDTIRMGDVVTNMLHAVSEVLICDDRAAIKRVIAEDDNVDNFYISIMSFLTELGRRPLSREESVRCAEVMNFVINLEHIGDIIAMNIGELLKRRSKFNLKFSAEDDRNIRELLSVVEQNLLLSFDAFLSRDENAIEVLIQAKKDARERERKFVRRHLAMLREGKAVPGEASAMIIDLLRDLRRVNSHLAAAAYPINEVDLL